MFYISSFANYLVPELVTPWQDFSFTSQFQLIAAWSGIKTSLDHIFSPRDYFFFFSHHIFFLLTLSYTVGGGGGGGGDGFHHFLNSVSGIQAIVLMFGDFS